MNRALGGFLHKTRSKYGLTGGVGLSEYEEYCISTGHFASLRIKMSFATSSMTLGAFHSIVFKTSAKQKLLQLFKPLSS